jgi:hypothetical protein
MASIVPVYDTMKYLRDIKDWLDENDPFLIPLIP